MLIMLWLFFGGTPYRVSALPCCPTCHNGSGNGIIDKFLNWYNPTYDSRKFTSEDTADCNPSASDCNTAIKILEQADRLAQKYGLKLPQKRVNELRQKSANGTISSNDLPATLRDKFPAILLGKPLDEIRRICNKPKNF